ncbi:hypothetical protein RRF57_007888 [Xylaria bambusicola]|uniref:Uncharacterized protein n=1 Tax=Xylaria bambusicola TaxID=326684 RepID=A0AAN7UW27_9PEZI
MVMTKINITLSLASEESRALGPLMTVNDWHGNLLRAAFNGPEIALSDGSEEIRGLSLLVSSVPPLEIARREPPSNIMLQGVLEGEVIAKSFQGMITARSDGICYITTAKQLISPDAEYDRCICLLKLGGQLMDQMDNTCFMVVQKLLQTAKEVIWVNNSCEYTADKPKVSTVSGFGKTITHGRPNLSFIHINVELTPSIVAQVMRVIHHNEFVAPNDRETDLLQYEDDFHIPRLVEAPEINHLFESELCGPKPVTIQVDKSNEVKTPVKLCFTPWSLDSIYFRHDHTLSRT